MISMPGQLDCSVQADDGPASKSAFARSWLSQPPIGALPPVLLGAPAAIEDPPLPPAELLPPPCPGAAPLPEPAWGPEPPMPAGAASPPEPPVAPELVEPPLSEPP